MDRKKYVNHLRHNTVCNPAGQTKNVLIFVQLKINKKITI